MFAYSPEGFLRDRLRRPQPEELLVLEGATLIDGTGTAPRPDSTIVLRGDRIERVLPAGVQPDLPVESAPERLDLAGRFVMPGMIDCHVHLTGGEGRDPFRRWIDRYPSVRILQAARDANRILAAGFTTVRHLGHGNAEHADAVKESIRKGLVAGPRMLTCGWAISQTGGHGNQRAWPYHLVEEMRPRSAFCDGPDACRKFVRRQLGDGAEWIKIYTTEGVITTHDRLMHIPNLSMPEIEAITDEAHRRSARVSAHATGLEGSINAVRGGVDSLEHGPDTPDEGLIRLMVDRGTSLVPTISVWEWASTEGLAHGLPAWVVEREARALVGRRAMIRAAREAGVTVAVGTDSGGAPRGGRNALELVAMVNAGLTPPQAIRAATLDAARTLGLHDRLGSIEPGKRADLLVLGSDPSRDISVLLDPAARLLVVQGRPDADAAA